MNKRLFAQLLAATLVLFAGAGLFAQGIGSMKGQVLDPSGAVVASATVTLKSATGQTFTATSNAQGNYEIKNLPAGSYTLTVTAAGFSPFVTSDLQIAAGKPLALDVPLQIQVEEQKVQVDAEAPTVSVSAENNASAMVLKGKDLDALSDDPDELQSELEALAGPSAGPNGGQIYIDGFTGGQLPPKSSIREIRVNSNPFSAEYDRLGMGRIEILTKPGTDTWHGGASFMTGNSTLNSKNPFGGANIPDYMTEQYTGNIGGPLSKKASFFFNVEHRNIGEPSIINATVLDSNFNPVPFVAGEPATHVRTNLGPRLDWQIGKSDTLTARYQFVRNINTTNGGGFNLPSTGTSSQNYEHQLQLTETHIISSTVVNETRFQFQHQDNSNQALTFTPTISVPGSFTSGGNSGGVSESLSNNYELQNFTMTTHGTHQTKIGGRLRVDSLNSTSTGNFNGSFSFASMLAYQITEQGLAQGLSMAQIRANGGGPNQFTIAIGQPTIPVTYADVGLYASDDWRVRPNITLSYGLRYETQNYIHEHHDFAPRVAVAWGLGSSKGTPKTVLRAGSGVFYDRFNQGNILNTLRLNGVADQQYVIQNPNFFPTIPSLSSISGLASTLSVFQEASHLRSPYIIQSAVAVERQINKASTLSVTYVNSRGFHQFFTDNINAPLPGTFVFGNPTSGVRPLGSVGNVYQYISDGVFKQNQLIVNTSYRFSNRVSLGGFYTLGYANSTPTGFPADPYNVDLDYGRAPFDVRHRFMLMGTATAPWGLRFNPFVVFNSGNPYNISIGQDINGDSILNDRPGFANTSATAVAWTASHPCPVGTQNCVTPLGAFSLAPGATPIPLYIATGPNNFTFNMRVSRTFGFGPERGGRNNNQNRGGMGGPGPGGEHGGGPRGGGLGPGGLGGGGMRGIMGGGNTSSRRYNLTLSVNARNLFNNVNFAPPQGSLGSPLFGSYYQLANGGGFGPGGAGGGAANRRLDFQAQFNF